MKKYIYILGLLLTAGLSACSNIAEDERLIKIETPDIADTQLKNVLIEDFTGQKCTNCPNATKAIGEMVEAFGHDRVIPVAVFSGPFGPPAIPTALNLVTEDGQSYWEHWFTNQQGQPVAKINRGAATSDYLNWVQPVREQLSQETDVNITAVATYNPTDNKVSISIDAKSVTPVSGKLQVYILEDNIVAMQTLPDNSRDRNYVHNHVLRKAVNGLWGEEVSLKTINTEADIKTYTVECDAKWKPADLSVVAFVYDDNGVMQVVSAHVESPVTE